ncbi:copia protein, partial [Tanacetum coccineum]
MYVDHMHQPWRTLAAIINKCLSSKAASNDRLRESKIDIIWGMFYRENEYGLPIPETMLNKGIKQSESYQMFIKNCTGQIPPKKSRGKGSQGKKTTDTSEADVEVSEESDSEPMRKQTSSRRVIKKKVIISTDDNIIPEPNIDLEIMTKSVPEPARRRPSGIDFRDTSSVSKKKSHDLSQKLKGVQTLTPKEQLVADIMKALKERVPDESIVVPATSSERTGTKPGVPDEEKEDDDDDNDDDDDDDDDDDNDNDDKSIDLEKIDDEETDDEFVHSEENVQDDDEETDDEETDDEIVHANEQVNDNEDEEMTNAEEADTRNGDEENIDAAKVDVEKTKVVKDEIKKVKLPPKISSLFVSPGFGNQFLNLSSNTSLAGIVKDTTYAEINSLLDPLVLTPIPKNPSVAPATTLLPPSTVFSISYVLLQTTTPIPTPPITTEAPSVTTIPDPLHVVIQRVYVLKKDVQELKEVDNTITLRTSLISEIPSAINAYLGSSLGDALQKEDPKKVLRKRDHDNEDPLTGPNQGKKTKKSRAKESESSKKSSTSKETST